MALGVLPSVLPTTNPPQSESGEKKPLQVNWNHFVRNTARHGSVWAITPSKNPAPRTPTPCQPCTTHGGILAMPCTSTLLLPRRKSVPLMRAVTDLHLMGPQKLNEDPCVIQAQICTSAKRADPAYQVLFLTNLKAFPYSY